MDDRPKTIPELRGFTPTPWERTKAYSAESYAAQYGITVDDANELIREFGRDAHKEIDRAIQRMFSEDPELKDRALNYHIYEDKKAELRRTEVEKERAEKRMIEQARQDQEKESTTTDEENKDVSI